MPRGGWRPGSGRKPGSVVKRKSHAIIAAAIEAEMTPLDYMLAVMKDETAEQHRRDDMAKAAAPFCHPKLASVDATVAASISAITNVRIVSAPSGHFLTHDQIRALEQNNELLPAPKIDPEIQHLWDLDHSARNLIEQPAAPKATRNGGDDQ